MKNVLRWLKSLLSMVFHFRRWMRRRTSSLKDDDSKVDEMSQKAALYLQHYYLTKLKLQYESDKEHELTNEDIKAILATLNCLNKGKESDKNDRQPNSTTRNS